MPQSASPSVAGVGLAVFKVFVQHALKAIPVVGPWFELSFDVYKAVKEEIQRSENRPLSDEEIAVSMKALTEDEVADAVDSSLCSPEGSRAIASLDADKVQEVRRRLMSLPSAIDKVIARLQAGERSDQRKRREWEARHYEELKKRLLNFLENNSLESGLSVAEEILAINPRETDALKAEAFLFLRHGAMGRVTRALCAITALLFAAIVLFAVYPPRTWSVLEAIVWILAGWLSVCLFNLVVFIEDEVGVLDALWRKIPRTYRQVFPVALCLLSLALAVGGFVLLFMA
jgi:hypothetical protein